MNIEPKFQPGQLVTLEAMLRVPPIEGKPLIMSVVITAVFLDASGLMNIAYYCRLLAGKQTWDNTLGRQTLLHGSPTRTGLRLFDEVELVAYRAELDEPFASTAEMAMRKVEAATKKVQQEAGKEPAAATGRTSKHG